MIKITIFAARLQVHFMSSKNPYDAVGFEFMISGWFQIMNGTRGIKISGSSIINRVFYALI
ncbi:hypothetical protein D7235_08355 [Legionella pneumophila]|uniref:Uncharacterized protein n=1 Tax=Legionella pneumophila subsp. pneumophila TaxID=91891 RepID=A0A3A6V317_LEGPN|nr:hypothetical protein A9P84_09565 [Legionella pneumophila]ERB40805.1 hypothetical protein N748_12190 [Legionella pneumophila str. 121004]ERH44848.1 hypothetical protein N751_12840 [Legionella pneumophila str. Leg01/11]ERH45476.1 hypothetical protein N750_01335 [Legionella pneumophila str. Leg01/53]ERI47182.1 hypothetical protein N749_02835 [Legionella pneumophila str. Leg01/20]RJY24871.1 hypothetical protein D1I00_13395 [Legionella pneumophila subsp. pneumophila]